MPLTENNTKVLAQMPEKYQELFKIFFELAEIPRGSGNRGPITAYLKQWAESKGFACDVDETSNLLIKVPATKGRENVPCVCLQAHTDKVDVKDPSSTHDFTKDPLTLRIQDEFLMATGTTLGADDGMGLAMAMMAAIDDYKHGPLELLFTSDEEIGLIGANALKKCLEAKYLLNLDSEEYGDICVSCAGGFRVDISKHFESQPIPAGMVAVEFDVCDYLGGHSGADIHKYRANAIKEVGKLIQLIPERFEPRLISINGGTAHNAIPAFCKIRVAIKPMQNAQNPPGAGMQRFQELFHKITECYAEEPNAKCNIAKVEEKKCFSIEDTQEILNMISVLPHGPQRFSQNVKDFVETSFAATVVKTVDGTISVLGSGRSCFEEELDMVYLNLQSICKLAKWNITPQQSRYPGWPANMDSPLLKITEAEYEKIYPGVRVTAIHAGLEAGLITQLHPGLDAISIGPTILSPHSPSERCEIETVGPCYEVVKNMLVGFANM